MPLEEEGTQDGGGHDQKDTREKPAGGCLRGIRIATGELAVGLDAAHQAEHRTDGIAQFGGGIEIRGHELVASLIPARPWPWPCAKALAAIAAHITEKGFFSSLSNRLGKT